MAIFETLKIFVNVAQEKRKKAQFEKMLLDDRAVISVLDERMNSKDMDTQICLLDLISQGKSDYVNIELEKIYSTLGVQTYAEKLKALEGFKGKKYEEAEKSLEKIRENIKSHGDKKALANIDKKIADHFARKSALALALSVSSFMLLDKQTRDYAKEADTIAKETMARLDKQMKAVDKMTKKQMDRFLKDFDK